MSVFVNSDFNPKQLSPQTLAFMGDTVYDLLVREYLINKANRPVGELNKRKVNYVKCEAQSRSADFIMSELTETELQKTPTLPITTALQGWRLYSVIFI